MPNVETLQVPSLEMPTPDEVSTRKRDGSHSKENVVSTDKEFVTVCNEKGCQVQYKARRDIFKDGTSTVSPPRCPDCQTVYIVNIRVNKQIQGFRHLGNLKIRLAKQPDMKKAIIKTIANELQVLMDVYAGTAVSTGGFDIRKIEV